MSEHGLKVVGIGASAGGLDAFKSFFEPLPADGGMAFVVILHLPADYHSMLPVILARWTDMSVVEAADGMQLAPNRVHVPPPHATTTLERGRLRIVMPDPERPRDYRPIDRFFDSLAQELRDNAVGIVLSGTGTDGALGLKAIKQNGGLTIAQGLDAFGPEYDGMPFGAIATGAVDVVAPADAIASHLACWRTSGPVDPRAETAEMIETARETICGILSAQVGHDFSGYRDKTFMRRVYRRMQVLRLTSLADYVVRLRLDEQEPLMLFRDLLIRVTSFFRDKETFDVLARLAIPRLFASGGLHDAVRVWVPGCSTGEEAYSLAILMREHMDKMEAPPKVHVFGTDIDEPAIATARLGQYPQTLLDGLSPERRDRFFRKTPSGYLVADEIRNLCAFSVHSIVRDPPFSRIDLVSCRNLFIYMDLALQSRVLPVFHYALRPDGLLLLGRSETTSRREALFEPLDKPSRIFIRRSVRGPPLLLNAGQPRQPGGQAKPSLLLDWRAARAELNHQAGGSDQSHMRSDRGADHQEGMFGQMRHAMSQFFRSAFGGRALSAQAAEELRGQLASTQAELQAVTEEHEGALEELRSANEELHSVNEELQSANEELETSKAELQSINDEINSVNARLTDKIAELDRSNSDMQNLFDSTQIATIFLDRHLIIRSFTPAVGAIYNLIPSDQGRPLTDIVTRLRYDTLREDVSQVLDTLQPLERRVTQLDDQAHYLMRILPYRSPDASVSGTLVTFLEVTSLVQAEQHHRLLIDELNHRVKNMLTVVISLASQTLRRAATLEQFSQAFMGRVHALTASYSLLSGQNWVDVPLKDVLVEETKPFVTQDKRNVVMSGPDLRLGPAAALAVGMAIHELTTNAVKHGALSKPEGTVSIDWRMQGEASGRQLLLVWQETNGPPVRAPEKRGFGMTLIERGFSYELSGGASMDFDQAGLRATLHAPARTVLATTAPL